jgi:hypothetical protein
MVVMVIVMVSVSVIVFVIVMMTMISPHRYQVWKGGFRERYLVVKGRGPIIGLLALRVYMGLHNVNIIYMGMHALVIGIRVLNVIVIMIILVIVIVIVMEIGIVCMIVIISFGGTNNWTVGPRGLHGGSQCHYSYMCMQS